MWLEVRYEPSMIDRDAIAGLGIAAITTVYGLVIALVASVAGYGLDALAAREEAVAP